MLAVYIHRDTHAILWFFRSMKQNWDHTISYANNKNILRCLTLEHIESMHSTWYLVPPHVLPVKRNVEREKSQEAITLPKTLSFAARAKRDVSELLRTHRTLRKSVTVLSISFSST